VSRITLEAPAPAGDETRPTGYSQPPPSPSRSRWGP